MVSNNYFKNDLIFLDKTYETKFDLFKEIGQVLISKKYVKETFIDGLIQREKSYPTGLPVIPYPVAIPHANPEYVLEKSITVVRLKKPLEFYEMGTEDKKIMTEFVFILTMNETTQVPVLKDLMELFLNEDFMKELKCRDYEGVLELLETITRKEENDE